MKPRTAGEWIKPDPKGFLLACCDCGLVHRMDFRVNNRQIEFRALSRRARNEATQNEEKEVNKLSKWLRKVLEIPDERLNHLDTFSPPVTPDPEATKQLETKWRDRQRELAGWQPSNGWLIWDPNDDR